MGNNVGDNRLAVLAAEIQEADGRFRRSTEQAAAAAIEAGQLLIEAKAVVPHGRWLPWLRDHCGLSDRSARRYMQLSRAGMEIGHVANLGIRGASEAIAKRRDDALGDDGYGAWVDLMTATWAGLMRAYAQMPAKERVAIRPRFADLILTDCEEPDGLVAAFLRQTKAIDEALAAHKPPKFLGWDWSQEEIERRERDARVAINAD